jgi:hypothetical protein
MAAQEAIYMSSSIELTEPFIRFNSEIYRLEGEE